jgi:hypothetical protein
MPAACVVDLPIPVPARRASYVGILVRYFLGIAFHLFNLGWLHTGYVLALVLSLEGIRDDTVRPDFAASCTGLIWVQVDVTFCLLLVRMATNAIDRDSRNSHLLLAALSARLLSFSQRSSGRHVSMFARWESLPGMILTSP